jgi:hypothetical protein
MSLGDAVGKGLFAAVKEGVKITLREMERGGRPRTVAAERLKLKVTLDKAKKAVGRDDCSAALDLLTKEIERWKNEGTDWSDCPDVVALREQVNTEILKLVPPELFGEEDDDYEDDPWDVEHGFG